MGASGRRTRAVAVAAAVAAGLVLSACSSPQAADGPAAIAVAEQVPQHPLAAGGMQDPDSTGTERMPLSSGSPIRVRVPAIGVDSALESLDVGLDGRLGAPVDYDLAGWYARGVVPGAVGPAIIAGHVDSPSAPAVFARLGELSEGDEVLVDMSDGVALRFRVTGSAQSAKADFPTAEVYQGVPAPELRLITCAGAFDSSVGHYTDNLIVFATLQR